ncbi:MAG TPA: LysR family transcriptional regulator, partial [Verrucomicrobiae bacterium]|nr:LysR family transcriptional regulator [Verrucomicrobiae bacterium]
MNVVNQYLPTTPFDIYELHLFHLVARHGSFTKAGEIAGLTQSAITRQVQGMESALGVPLLERTTRRVSPTPAGDFLLRETRRILGDIDTALLRLRENFADAPREVRVGVSRTISLAHLPGFFFANQRKHPEILTRVSHQYSREIIESLEAGDLDLGVISSPAKLPAPLRITHRFNDDFALIAPQTYPPPATPARWPGWLAAHPMLMIHEQSNTGRELHAWL